MKTYKDFDEVIVVDRRKYAAIWNNMFLISSEFFSKEKIANDYVRCKSFNQEMQKLLACEQYPIIEKAYRIFLKCFEENIMFENSKEFFGRLWQFFLKYAMNEEFTEAEKHNIFKDIEEFNEIGLEPIKEIKAKFAIAVVDEVFWIHKNREFCSEIA